ncbi:hypothetical protein ATANTOWER_030605 [Ataeniobius toweri]|uniref:Uncharacterized protein n=1 Tax=Ataeniobius toweri TaxID=208326 RepID=A0ABU7CLF5_9TELE|nr:hypothetical protein [Ataeniobius toweri]
MQFQSLITCNSLQWPHTYRFQSDIAYGSHKCKTPSFIHHSEIHPSDICFTCITHKITVDTLPFTQPALIKAIHKPHQLHTFFTLSYSPMMFFPGEFEPNS